MISTDSHDYIEFTWSCFFGWSRLRVDSIVIIENYAIMHWVNCVWGLSQIVWVKCGWQFEVWSESLDTTWLGQFGHVWRRVVGTAVQKIAINYPLFLVAEKDIFWFFSQNLLSTARIGDSYLDRGEHRKGFGERSVCSVKIDTVNPNSDSCHPWIAQKLQLQWDYQPIHLQQWW